MSGFPPDWLEEGARHLREVAAREGDLLFADRETAGAEAGTTSRTEDPSIAPSSTAASASPVRPATVRKEPAAVSESLFGPGEAGPPWGGRPPRPGHDPVGIPASMLGPVPEEKTGRITLLEQLQAETSPCLKCPLGETRHNLVFGSGNPDANIMFIGEAPGADEDEQGLPFVGAAGRLLTKIIESIGLGREEVYIANILKCRPPRNRDPQPGEVAACEPYLHRQIGLIQPAVICALGRIAAQALLKTSASLTKMRGKVHRYQGRPLVVTYHPAALLRNPNWKRPTWEDVQMLRRIHDEETGT